MFKLIEELGGIAIVVFALAWVLRKAIEAFLNAKLDQHKNELDKANLEFQHKLDQTALEHRVRFESLHTERADVIRNCYEKLMALDDHLGSTLSIFQPAGDPPLEEKVRYVGEAFNELRGYFRPHRIYFDEETAKLMEEILKTVFSAYLDLTTYPINLDDLHGDRNSIKERGGCWDKARGKYNEQVTEMSSRLEKTFRGFLGVDA